jgi:hypothetical protein
MAGLGENRGPDPLLEAGLAYLSGGINLIPVNSRKTPADPPLPYQKWKKYQAERVIKAVLRTWAKTPGVNGWAMVCGKISGGLTILDFDEPGFYESWKAKVGELAQTLPTQQTGSGEGYQVAFRSNLPIRNDKLAYVPADNEEGRITAIETRGEGGYAVVAPSYCPKATKRGKKHRQPYKVIQGDFAKIPAISDKQAQFLLDIARNLDEMPLSKKQMQAAPLPPQRNEDGRNSGVIGAFNENYEVSAILKRNGYERRENRFLAPDSTSGLPGVHIFSDGRCYSHHGNDLLSDGHSHDAFDVFRILEHGGDIKAAVKAAAEKLGIKASVFVGVDATWQPPLPPKWPDPPSSDAFHGLAGKFVGMVSPHTEADSVALLGQFLTYFGNVIGPDPYYQVEGDRHHANIFTNPVGETSKARKGTSHGHVRNVFGQVEPAWVRDKITGGLSSGEGLIWEVRDPITKREPVKQNGRLTGEYQELEIDSGVTDKRLLVYEPEFSSVLKVMGREGNNLSDVIRKGWDGSDLRTMTKNSPARATGAHISIIGHITANELRRYLDKTEMANGFGNRFIWLCVKRSKILPHGGQIHTVNFSSLIQRLTAAVKFARQTGQISMAENTAELWQGVYGPLSEGKPGLTGALLARAEAQVVRVAMIYALLDQSALILPEHLQAALALWDFAEKSVRFIFGDSLGDPVADLILGALKTAIAGLTRTEISNLFGRNKNAGRIAVALNLLLTNKLARVEYFGTGGRKAETWFYITK